MFITARGLREKCKMLSIDSKFRWLIFWCSLPILFSSCERPVETVVSDAPHKEICVLKENLSLLGRLNGFAVVSKNRFVVSTDTKVILYDADSGNQIREIGEEGRARFEYLMPMMVNGDGEKIYVWSANDLEFITYSLEGAPLSVFPFSSAIDGFIPSGNSIFIYSTGLRADRSVIDVFDTGTSTIADSIGTPTNNHKLSSWFSLKPMTIIRGRLYWMRKDALNIYAYDIGRREDLGMIGSIESDSFRIEPCNKDIEELSSDARQDLLYGNSFPVGIFGSEKKLYVVTSEGESYLEATGGSKRLNSDNRYFSVYSYNLIDGVSRKEFSFAHSSIAGYSLIAPCGNECYYLEYHSAGDSEFYTLNRLELE